MPCERCKGIVCVLQGARRWRPPRTRPIQPQRLTSLVDGVTEMINWARTTQILRLRKLQASTYVKSSVHKRHHSYKAYNDERAWKDIGAILSEQV
jgi:hypothetical protein